MKRGLILPLGCLLSLGLWGWSCGGDSDKKRADSGPTPDTRTIPNEAFGSVCTNLGEKCKAKDKDGYTLHCIALTGSISGKGFCSRQCSDAGNECYNIPNGMMAGCFIEAGTNDDSGPGTKYCGLYCKSSKGTYNCPPTLQCDKKGSQGQDVCKPLK